MSVRDRDVIINLYDSLNGDLVTCIDNLDDPEFYMCPMSMGELRLFSELKKLIKSEHGGMVKVAYRK